MYILGIIKNGFIMSRKWIYIINGISIDTNLTICKFEHDIGVCRLLMLYYDSFYLKLRPLYRRICLFFSSASGRLKSREVVLDPKQTSSSVAIAAHSIAHMIITVVFVCTDFLLFNFVIWNCRRLQLWCHLSSMQVTCVITLSFEKLPVTHRFHVVCIHDMRYDVIAWSYTALNTQLHDHLYCRVHK